jgi:hypothetical protein
MEFWGDGAGAALAVTVNNVWGSTITVTTENFLRCVATLSGTAATAIDMQLQVSYDNGTNWTAHPHLLERVAMRGDVASHVFTVKAPIHSQVRIGLSRRGGAADTSALILCFLREHGGDEDETRPIVTNRAIARDTGLLTGADQYGDCFDLGDADELELLLVTTLGNNPTNVDISIQVSPDQGTTGFDPTQIDQVAGGFESRSVTIKRITDIGAAVGNWELLVTGMPKAAWCRVGALFNGGTAPTVQITALCHRL